MLISESLSETLCISCKKRIVSYHYSRDKNYITMRLILFSIFLTVLSSFSANAQFTVRNCGAAKNRQQSLIDDPAFQNMDNAIQAHFNDYIKYNSVTTREDKIITIPVVVHVFYNSDAENISDAQVKSQIDALNRDYNAGSIDVNKTPSIFQKVLANCKIQFVLAKLDPNQAPTTGITRHQSSKQFWGLRDDVKKPASGGTQPWDSNKYLNLYVARIGDGVLGYSSSPGCKQEVEGVVIDPSCFGTTGIVHAPFNKGRTAIHEVGHWLGLNHIWGDTECGDDRIADTPIHQNAHYGTITNAIYSNCTGINTQDMTMNFMDYVNDESMWMFTEGQKAMMWSLLSKGGYRETLDNPSLANPTSTCDSPILGSVINRTSTTSTIAWAATGTNGYYTIEYRLKDATESIILNTESTQIELSNLKQARFYEFRIKVSCGNGNFSNWTEFNTTPKRSFLDGVNIYPNPINSILNIGLPSNVSATENVSWSLISQSGKVIYNSANNFNLNTIDMNDASVGVYFLELSTPYETVIKTVIKADF